MSPIVLAIDEGKERLSTELFIAVVTWEGV